MRPGLPGPTTLGELLSSSATLRSRTAQISLVDWRRAVGERIASKTQPERLLDGVLTVRVPTSTWAQELSMLADTVRKRLVEMRHPVRKLRFQVSGRLPRRPQVVVVRRRCALPEDLERRLRAIADPELREAIADAASYSLGRRARR